MREVNVEHGMNLETGLTLFSGFISMALSLFSFSLGVSGPCVGSEKRLQKWKITNGSGESERQDFMVIV